MTVRHTDPGAAEVDADVARAVDALSDGGPVLVHDAADREGETDLVYPAGAVSTEAVARMRNDAGGLICAAVSDPVADRLGLPFLADEIDHAAASGGDLGYDERSSFSLPVNHRDTYTGITDEDRSLTITELAAAAEAAREGAYTEADFAEDFRTPGHVHLLRGAPRGLTDREGHTELGLALADAADLPPAVVVCEMLDDATGEELTPAAARDYAERNGLVYVEGARLVEAFA